MTRNVFCPQYRQCLDRAVARNLTAARFDCSGCYLERTHLPLDTTDYVKSIVLLCAAYRPELYQEYQTWARRTA